MSEEIKEIYGFEICDFGPDNDPCEYCGFNFIQLYCHGSDDVYTYSCLDCIIKRKSQDEADLLKHGLLNDNIKGEKWARLN